MPEIHWRRLTWAKRKNRDINNDNIKLEEWYAVSTSPLTSDAITVTYGVATGTVTNTVPPSGTGSKFIAFGVSDANTSTPFDPKCRGSEIDGYGVRIQLPVSNSISTTKARDMVINFYGAAYYGSLDTFSRPSGYYGIAGLSTAGEASYSLTGRPLTSNAVTYANTINADNISGQITDAIQTSGL